MFKKTSQSTKLNKYVDSTGSFDNSQLKQALWFTTHRDQLRKIMIWILGSWSALSIGVSGFFWVKYFTYDLWFVDNPNLVAQTLQFQNYAAIQGQYSAIEPVVGRSDIFQSGEDRYDFVTKIQNQDPNFLARVDYYYDYGSAQTPTQSVILLPNSESLAAVLGVESEVGFPRQARLIIDTIQYRRVNPHTISDPQEYINTRLNLMVSGTAYIAQNEAEGIATNGIQFSIENPTVFSYWELPIYVELIRTGQTVGVTYTNVRDFRARSVRDVELYLAQTLPFIDSIRLYPLINVFDPNVFQDPEI